MNMSPVTLIMLTFASCFLGACGTHSSVSALDGKAKVAGDERMAVHSESAKDQTQLTMGDAASYPADMPFVQYPDSKVTLSIISPGQANKSVNLDTSDAPDKAVAYYKKWFTENKWKIVQQTSTTGMSSISAQAADKQASIMSMPGAGSSGKNSIQITMSSSK